MAQRSDRHAEDRRPAGIRVTKDLKARLTAQARSEMKSVSTLVVQLIEEYLDSKGKGNAG